jgi:biotin operon repressor
VLQALQGGPQLNHQLEKICRRVAARIDDLKKDGWEIVTDRLSFTDFRYTLKGKQL